MCAYLIFSLQLVMDKDKFFIKSSKEFPKYLKDKRVVFCDIRKLELIDLCQHGIDVGR